MNTPLQAPAQAAPMKVRIVGRIDSSRRVGEFRYTRVLTPAEDAYSRPQVLELRGKASLGQKGDDITVIAALGGYSGRPFKTTDKDTGEIRTATSVVHTLDVVE